MSKNDRRNYDAFEWLPLKRWSPETLMGPSIGLKDYCKICDVYVPRAESEEHIDRHIKTRKRHIADDKRRAKEARALALKLAREAKKLAGELTANKG